MAGFKDLSQFTRLASPADHILAVGWLDRETSFATGPTSREVFERLRTLARNPWQPFITMGVHFCELCQFEGEKCGKAILYIPFQSKIFVCPELITHYVDAHHYQPPLIFCEAVMACPAMVSMDYKRLLISCNGRVLWQVDDTTTYRPDL